MPSLSEAQWAWGRLTLLEPTPEVRMPLDLLMYLILAILTALSFAYVVALGRI